MVRQLSEVEGLVLRVVELVNRRFRVKDAYLFGSYAEGCPREESDIDIAIFAEGIESLGVAEKIAFISQVQKEIGAEVEIHLYPTSAISEARPSNFLGHIRARGRRIAA